VIHLADDNLPLLPFEIVSRRDAGEGEVWEIRCRQCGATTLLDLSSPSVGEGLDHACACGQKWILSFGPPRSGVDLLKAVEQLPPPSEDLHRRHPPCAN